MAQYKQNSKKPGELLTNTSVRARRHYVTKLAEPHISGRHMNDLDFLE